MVMVFLVFLASVVHHHQGVPTKEDIFLKFLKEIGEAPANFVIAFWGPWHIFFIQFLAWATSLYKSLLCMLVS